MKRNLIGEIITVLLLIICFAHAETFFTQLDGTWNLSESQGQKNAISISSLTFFDESTVVVNESDIWEYTIDGENIVLKPFSSVDRQEVKLLYQNEQLIYSDEGTTVIFKKPDAALPFNYIIQNEQVYITGLNPYFSDSLTEMQIPDDVEGYPVVCIQKEAFQAMAALQKVILPNSLNTIEDSAFRGCRSLVEINLPSELQKIGNSAFENCVSLQSISIPASVTNIGNKCFANCSSLAEVELNAGLQKIGDAAFINCEQLGFIEIPEGMAFFAYSWFDGCNDLSVYLPASIRDCDFTKDNSHIKLYVYWDSYIYWVCRGDEVTGTLAHTNFRNAGDYDVRVRVYLTNYLYFPNKVYDEFYITGYNGEEENIIIPDHISGYPVTGIYRISSDKVKSIVIPDTVTMVDGEAFSGCSNLETVFIPSSVKLLGGNNTRPYDVFSLDASILKGANSNAVVIVDRDSYAAKYCQEHAIYFIYSDETDKILTLEKEGSIYTINNGIATMWTPTPSPAPTPTPSPTPAPYYLVGDNLYRSDPVDAFVGVYGNDYNSLQTGKIKLIQLTWDGKYYEGTCGLDPRNQRGTGYYHGNYRIVDSYVLITTDSSDYIRCLEATYGDDGRVISLRWQGDSDRSAYGRTDIPMIPDNTPVPYVPLATPDSNTNSTTTSSITPAPLATNETTISSDSSTMLARLKGAWICQPRFNWLGYILNGDGTGYEVTGSDFGHNQVETMSPITYDADEQYIYITDKYQYTSKYRLAYKDNGIDIQYFENDVTPVEYEDRRRYGKELHDIVAATPTPVPSVPPEIGQWLYGSWAYDYGNGSYEVYTFEANYATFDINQDRSTYGRTMQYAVDGDRIYISGEYLNTTHSATLRIGTYNGQYILYDEKYPSNVYVKYSGSTPYTSQNSGSVENNSSSKQLQSTSEATQASSSSILESFGEPGYMKINVAQIDATTWITSPEGYQFVPANMLDNDDNTSFQFSTNAKKLGKEYLYFAFQEPIVVDEVWMKNGVWSSDDAYERNSRVKTFTISYLYAGDSNYTGNDTFTIQNEVYPESWMIAQLGRHANVIGVRIRIDDQYTGTKYKTDVCISELMFVQMVQ